MSCFIFLNVLEVCYLRCKNNLFLFFLQETAREYSIKNTFFYTAVLLCNAHCKLCTKFIHLLHLLFDLIVLLLKNIKFALCAQPRGLCYSAVCLVYNQKQMTI